MDERQLAVRRFVVMSIGMCLLLLRYYTNHIRPRYAGRKRPRTYKLLDKIPSQKEYIDRLTLTTDTDCKNVLRMKMQPFREFCWLLRHKGGMCDSKYVRVEEKVATFMQILGHHVKNRVAMFAFRRSGHTISIYFHEVLRAVLSLHELLLAKPIAIKDDEEDERWKPFVGCIGALDGTHVRLHIGERQQAHYRNRKGVVTTNVLGVCDRDMRFIHVLTGWEGSANDGKVLRDAITRPNGLVVPQGNYYLADSGYALASGFLTPYRGARYHLKEWGDGGGAPTGPEEYFNLKHAAARNVIERAFGLWKKRFGILRSPAFYSLDTQNDIILACALVHNFLRDHSKDDLMEWYDNRDDEELLDDDIDISDDDDDPEEEEYTGPVERILDVHPEPGWNADRDDLACTMFSRWRAIRRRARRM